MSKLQPGRKATHEPRRKNLSGDLFLDRILWGSALLVILLLTGAIVSFSRTCSPGPTNPSFSFTSVSRCAGWLLKLPGRSGTAAP